MQLKRFLGYITVFVLGFLVCAVILRFGNAGIYNAGASSRGREDIEKALAQPARATPSIANASAVADAAAKVEPAVVNIDIAGRRAAARSPFGFLRPNSEDDFQGSGSGIILSGDGVIVTNNHVVEPVAESRDGKITIKLDNGREFTDVRILGRDAKSDLAVLKINNVTGLPAATLGDSDKIRVGDWAIAVGNPLGYNSSVTLGIVSALNRRDFQVENEALDRVIQTDASINPGNSGGALADISGQVIGINTAIATQTGLSNGIGFAIPINAARRIIEQLAKRGEVVRPYLGVVYSPLVGFDRTTTPPGIQLPTDNQGALILSGRGRSAVAPNSPAAKAGLRDFDVIREIDGVRIVDTNVVRDRVQARTVGETIPLKVWRNGQTLEINVRLEQMPNDFGRANFGP